MKKIIFTILICGFIVLGLTGCENSKNEFKVGSESDIQISQSEVTLAIKSGTLKNTGATLILTNNSDDKTYQYGNPYIIEIKQSGKWHSINVELNFILPVYNLYPEEKKEIELNWENGYGKLSEGTYRIIKNVYYEKEENLENYNIAVEFTID